MALNTISQELVMIKMYKRNIYVTCGQSIPAEVEWCVGGCADVCGCVEGGGCKHQQRTHAPTYIHTLANTHAEPVRAAGIHMRFCRATMRTKGTVFMTEWPSDFVLSSASSSSKAVTGGGPTSSGSPGGGPTGSGSPGGVSVPLSESVS